MSNPVAGQQYIVKAGDTLSSIAASAYGDSTKWTNIWQANQQAIKSGDPEEVFPGEILFIPVIADLEKLKQDRKQPLDKDPDDFTLVIEDTEVPVLSANVIRTMDTAADGWTASIAWNPGADPKIDELIVPYKYPKAQVYLGNELVVSGYLYTVASNMSNAGSIVNLEGYSFTADIIDSRLKPSLYEQNNITLEQRAKNLVEPLGIKVIFDTDPGGPFKRVTASIDDTIFSHLVGLAVQRGILISSTPSGELIFLIADSERELVGTLEEGKMGVANWSAKWDGRRRFNTYRSVGQSPGANAKSAIVKDGNVPTSRFMTFNATDVEKGSIQKTADWQRSKQLVQSLTISLSVSGWYAPDETLWRENTLVMVISDSLFLPEGYFFLIRQVQYIFNNDGISCILSLIPPQVYNSEPLFDPWGAP